jgi:hypothetical protein
VISMTPVLARGASACPFWPAEVDDYYLVLRRLPAPEQVGAAVWALIERSVTAEGLPGTATEAIETYLTSSDDDFAPGGLRVTDGEVVVDPGCCVGLDEWRNWLEVPAGHPIDLGHDPDVLLEHRGPVLRLWKDKDHLIPGKPPGADEQYIDMPRDALLPLLRAVRQDLVGFLAALHAWTRGIDAELAEPLAAAVDRRLRISAPLSPTW